MHNLDNEADRQYWILCNRWDKISKEKQRQIIKTISGNTIQQKKKTIVEVMAIAMSIIVFASFGDTIGLVVIPISVLSYFYSVFLGGFLFDWIINTFN